MNKITLGATFVAIAALVGTPILAEAIEDLNGVRVQTDDDGNFKNIIFRTQDVVPEFGLVTPGGYAIPTTGDFIAVTSHPGVLDSEAQNDDADNAIWHSHLVKVSESRSCENVAIAALSFEEPSTNVLVRDDSNNIWVKTIANGTATYTDGLTERELEFTVGNPNYLESDRPHSGEGPIRVPGEKSGNGPVRALTEPRVNGLVESISFDLNVTEDGDICIGDLVVVDEKLPNNPWL